MSEQGDQLIIELMTRNSSDIAATTNAVLAGTEAERNAMAKAFVTLYDSLEAIPLHTRTVYVDRLLDGLANQRMRAGLFLGG